VKQRGAEGNQRAPGKLHARINRVGSGNAAPEQPGGYEQNERHSHLRDHEGPGGGEAAAMSRQGRGVLERRHQVLARGAKRGDEAERGSGQQRDGEGEQQRAQVDGDVERDGQVGRQTNRRDRA
jgi:hypothetical protein